jgi:hypothetical protein
LSGFGSCWTLSRSIPIFSQTFSFLPNLLNDN